MAAYSGVVSQITDALYLSGYMAVTPSIVQQLGITNIVNVTMDMPNTPNCYGVEFTRVRIDDSPSYDISAYFDVIADKIQNSIAKGGKVLVHCMAGVSRSATLVIAYLMKYQGMSLSQAYEFVRQRRPIIHPNVGFFNQLCRFEQQIQSQQTIRMINRPCIGFPIPDVYLNGNKGLVWLESFQNNFDPAAHAMCTSSACHFNQQH